MERRVRTENKKRELRHRELRHILGGRGNRNLRDVKFQGGPRGRGANESRG
jgi:hypothetical protein